MSPLAVAALLAARRRRGIAAIIATFVAIFAAADAESPRAPLLASSGVGHGGVVRECVGWLLIAAHYHSVPGARCLLFDVRHKLLM